MVQAYLQIYMICARAPSHQNLRPGRCYGPLCPSEGHLAVLTEYKNVWKRTHHYVQNQGDIMKEGTIFPPPPPPHNKRDTFGPPTVLGSCDHSQFML